MISALATKLRFIKSNEYHVSKSFAELLQRFRRQLFDEQFNQQILTAMLEPRHSRAGGNPVD